MSYYGSTGGRGGSAGSGNTGGFSGYTSGAGKGGAGSGVGGGGGGAGIGAGGAGGAGGYGSGGARGGDGGAGGAAGFTLTSTAALSLAGAVGGAGANGVFGVTGAGGGGGGGGMGVDGRAFATTLTLSGAVTGGRAGSGGGSALTASGSGGNGGSGGVGVVLSSGTVSIVAGGSVAGGGGGNAGGTTGFVSGQGGEGVVFKTGAATLNTAAGTSVTGGAGGAGLSGSAKGGTAVIATSLTLASAGDITGGAGAAGGSLGAGVNAGELHGTNSGAIRGGAGAGPGQAAGAVITGYGDLTNTASGSLIGGAATGAGAGVGGYGFTGGSFAYGNLTFTLTNQGLIQGGADNTTGAAGVGGQAISSDRLILNNSGTIQGGAGHVGGVGLGAGQFTITNSGVISGGLGAGGAVGGALQLGGGPNSIVLSTSAGTGTIVGDISTQGVLSIDPGSAASVTLSNVIKDGFSNGSVTKIGANTLILSGASTYTYATTVNAGVLEVSGSLTSLVTVNRGGTLRGAGSTTVGVTVASGGVFAPGGASGTGTFTISAGDLSVGSGATFAETLTSAVSYGTASVAGQVTLGGTLSLTVAGAGPVGTVYTLVRETGATAVSGTFAGQAEGSSITQNGFVFRISYVGGAGGHDVTLTETTAPADIPPTIAGATAGQTVNDNATIRPFSTVVVADPDSASEAVAITVTAGGVASDADGLLSGAGLTKTGVGAYTLTSGSPADVTSRIEALRFTPTANQVAPGATVTTGFTLSVSDGFATPATTNAATTVIATSVNDPPVVTTGQVLRAPENQTAAGTVAATDPDPGDTRTFTLAGTGADNALFNISAAGVLSFKAAPDFEGAHGNSYSVTVQATDAGGLQSAPTAVTVNVTNVNEAPVVAAGQTFSAPENQTAAGTVTASDPDAGDTRTFALAGTGADNALFNISATGVLSFKAAPDFEGVHGSSYSVTVQATDAGGLQSAPTAVTVNVTNVNEAPVVAAGQTFSAPENQTAAGTVAASDPDAGDTRTFALAGTGADNALFNISAAGVLSFKAAPDFEGVHGSSYSVTVQVTDAGGLQSAATAVTVNVTNVNEAPVIGGVPTSATLQPAGTLVLAPAATVADVDAGASAVGARVAITSGFAVGDQLAVTAPPGIVAAYDPASGVLTLRGAASDAAYQAALRTVTFSHDGAPDGVTRQVSFSVTDEQGASGSATEAVMEATFPPSPTSTGGGGASISSNLDVQQGFPTQTSNLLRAAANDPDLANPTTSLYQQAQAEKSVATQLDNGQLSLADAQNALYHLVDGTTSVAEISYAFFTGQTPTAAGLAYLVHSSANPTDLNDVYYAQFTTENRYINFGANLAVGSGAGATAFQAAYGSLSLSDAAAKAYSAVFGFAPAAGKIDAILNAQVSNGLGGTETRAQYFADVTGGTAAAQKAGVIGFLLADSVKEGFGTYQQADLHFLQDLAHGTAVFNVDLLAAYTQPPSLVGQAVPDPSLPH